MFEIQQQIKLIQTFPQEHSSDSSITCLLQINSNTIVSSASASSSNPDDNVIVIWTKSKSKSFYEPVQRITREEAGENINRLVLINQKKEGEEEFASCSFGDHSIIIWRREKGDKFRIKQKLTNVNSVSVYRLLYISQTNELISGSDSFPSSLLQIWSTSPSSSSSSSSSDFVERQKIKTSSPIYSLCQINRNDTKSRRIEFASGHENGQVMIWSKQQQIANESNHYSLCKTLKPFNEGWVQDLIFINDNRFECLISCCYNENKIKIFKGEEEEELEHEKVRRLILMSNGQFASGGYNQCLNIWSPSSSSLSSSS